MLTDASSIRRLDRDVDNRRKSSLPPAALNTLQMRSQRLIGNANPKYNWKKYYKSEVELKSIKNKGVREYYKRNNHLISQYMHIDRLLDSSLPHALIQEYSREDEEGGQQRSEPVNSSSNSSVNPTRIKRTPKTLYKIKPDERRPLLSSSSSTSLKNDDTESLCSYISISDSSSESLVDSQSSIVRTALWINLLANTILLVLKITVMILTSSVSILASLVDAALDFLSTAIIWLTTYLISNKSDEHLYPVGRRRLEPIGILVFSIIMITCFVQVGIEGLQVLFSSNSKQIVQLTLPTILIMSSTVLIKALCWVYCRLIRNSSVQALAKDAATDVVFNSFSIVFPLVGYYAKQWWLDPLGGILLSLYVILNWSFTSSEHIQNLSGRVATADQRNVLLYMTMRFAKTIRQIQGLNAFHAGDLLNVEADITLDEKTSLRDSHDVAESLQYMLESHPWVDRAFVHVDYKAWNLPSHMKQDEE